MSESYTLYQSCVERTCKPNSMSMKTFSIAFVSLSFVILSPAQNLSNVAWLVGTWKMQTKSGAMFEQWRIVDDSTLHGLSYKIQGGGDTVMLESVQLETRNGVMHYTPTAFGQNDDKPVPFRIVSSTKHEFVAENLEHDFPQRIIYRLKSEHQLHARIEGTVKGKAKGRDFPYERVE